jgi:hypothetical protein
MLSINPNAMSASHCQEGQQATVYDLKSINIATTGGKKRKTRKNRKTRKSRKQGNNKTNILFMYIMYGNDNRCKYS